MTQATDTQLGEIQLAGDLAGDGGAQVGTNPQLTYISGLTPGQYDVADITVDAKGRITAIANASSASIAGLIPDASTTQKGVVKIGDNLYIQDTATAGIWTVDLGGAITGTDSTGLANDSCSTYEFTIKVDGETTPQTISFSGDTAQTYADLINEINADLTGAIASISGGNIVITSSSTGKSSTVEIVTDSVFSCTTDYVGIGSATDGLGACELYAEDATTLVAGVVQIGTGIDVAAGVISVDLGTLPTATDTALGAVYVPTANGLSVAVDGSLSIDYAGTASKGTVEVPGGDGLVLTAGVLTLDSSQITLPEATSSTLGAVYVPGGDGLSVAVDGALTYTPSPLGAATSTTLGGVIIPSAGYISVDGSGSISIPTATASTPGCASIGSGLSITAGGELSVPVATTSSVGVVKPGTGLTITGSVLDVVDATTTVKGIASFSTGLDITGGVLSINLADATTKGVVSIGDNLSVTAGHISVPPAESNTTFGVVKSADTTRITISSGVVDTGTDVPLLSTSNTWTSAQKQDVETLTSANDDLSAGNYWKVNRSATSITFTNVQVGAWYTIVITNDDGSISNPDWMSNTNFKWRGGVTPSITGTLNAVDVLSFYVLDSTTWLADLVGDFS